MSAALVQLVGVSKRFEAAANAPGPTVLDHVDLELRGGESVAVVGPSGSGKSTLLNVIGALLPATEGRVTVDGVDRATLDADALAAFRNRDVGYVFQAHHLLPQCSALENVLVPTLVHPDDDARRSAPERARELLQEVGLSERLHHRPAQLSGGECQRVAVVRALINRPRLILADEPTGSLDAESSARLSDLLCSLTGRGVALLVVTHDQRLAARMDRAFALQKARLVPFAPAS